MKLRSALLALFICLSSSFSLAQASDTVEMSPSALFDALTPEVGARGIFFQENPDAVNTIGITRYSHIPKFNSDGTIDP